MARANSGYVDDGVNGLLQAAECGARGAAYVLGGENLTISQLLDLVAQVTGRRHRVVAAPQAAARAGAWARPAAGPAGAAAADPAGLGRRPHPGPAHVVRAGRSRAGLSAPRCARRHRRHGGLVGGSLSATPANPRWPWAYGIAP